VTWEVGGRERHHGGEAGGEYIMRINIAVWESCTSPRGEDTAMTRRAANRLGNKRDL
jgi:hypothetical protein